MNDRGGGVGGNIRGKVKDNMGSESGPTLDKRGKTWFREALVGTELVCRSQLRSRPLPVFS